MSEVNMSSSSVSVSQLGKNGVTTTYSVFDNGRAELKRCKQISGKEICLSYRDERLDKHGVSKIAAEGLGKCYDAARDALQGKSPKAEKIIAACEAMYAFARSSEMKPPARIAKAEESKPPEKPIK